jgi:hypothetical protein
MKRALLAPWLVVAACGLVPAARAAAITRSELAPALVEPAKPDEAPVLILAQRTIDRSWGPSEGAAPEAAVPGMLSEGRAMALSAALPGAGQLYAGEKSAILFALAEVAGWTTRWLYTRDARRESEHADQFVGVPADTASAWSYERWQQAGSGRDPAALEVLYAGDREAFYNLITHDERYFDGWVGPDQGETRADFQHLRDLSDGSTARARTSGKVIWLNHMASAFDALRAARIHNLPLRRNLELHINSSWRRSGPTMTAMIERRF